MNTKWKLINDSNYLLNTKNIINMKYIQKHYLLKLPACTLEWDTNNVNQCWIQNITLPYKFVGPWLFMCVTAGSLQIEACTKPTLRAILQIKFQYIGALKCIVCWIPGY